MNAVSLLGLGAMGAPMAEVLHAAGVELTVWNRTAVKAAGFAEQGVPVAATPAEAALPIVLTVLPDLVDVRHVLEGASGLLAGWERAGIPTPILVVMGTVSPVGIRELARDLAQRGVRVVDAPLSGGVIGAREARLSIMVGADAEVFEELRATFEILGSVVRLMGPVGSGQLAKACNQLIVAATVTAVSEGMLLAGASGLDRPALLEILLGGLASSEVLRQKGQNWITDNFEAGGTAEYQLKDLNFAIAAAEERGVLLPVSTTVRELFRALVADGDGHLDHTGVYRAIERLAAEATQQRQHKLNHD